MLIVKSRPTPFVPDQNEAKNVQPELSCRRSSAIDDLEQHSRLVTIGLPTSMELSSSSAVKDRQKRILMPQPMHYDEIYSRHCKRCRDSTCIGI